MVAPAGTAPTGSSSSPVPTSTCSARRRRCSRSSRAQLPLPRILPPYQVGLFATTADLHPTVVNNVETLSHVAHILAKGPTGSARSARTDSPGSMVFTVVGDVGQPGRVRTAAGPDPADPAGRHRRCRPRPDARRSTAGPRTRSSPPTCSTPSSGLRRDGRGRQRHGLGRVRGLRRHRGIVQVVAELSRFLAVESCGQCNACKLGTGAITDMLEAICAGDADRDTSTRSASGAST
jgi:NADH-quinone oxidoreductase subunit F